MGAPWTPWQRDTGEVLAATEAIRVTELPGRIYVLEVSVHLDQAVMDRALDIIWASPRWRQPWGLVVVLNDEMTYDADVRQYEVPPKERRAVGTAVVSGKPVYRTVVNSVGLGYRMVHRFMLSAHATVDEAAETQRMLVLKADASGRPY